MLQHRDLFLQQMKKKSLVYFTKHTTAGPSSRYRSYAYHSYLKANGFEITVHPLFPSFYLSFFYKWGRKPVFTALYAYARRFFQSVFIKKYNIIYIEYELFPYLPFWLEQWLLRKQKHIVIDYDDAVFHNYDNSKNKLVQRWCGDKIYRLVALADVVITGSPYLTKTLLPYAKEVVEIPTSVSIQLYNSTVAAHISTKEKQTFRIGWIGSATTSRFVLLIKDCLLQLHEIYNIKLVLIGFDTKLEKELQGLPYINYKWQQETEIALLKTCDVGIMPLPNEPFTQGKCGFKLIQYMACGLPTVSTPLEANIKINHGNDNLFATTTYEWYSCLSLIIQNGSFYKKSGVKNKDIVQQFYATENNRNCYLSLFQRLTQKL